MPCLLPLSPAIYLIRVGVLSLSVLLCIYASAQNAEADQLTQAQAALAKHDWATAEALLQPLAQSQPKNPFIFYDLAQVYESTNRVDAAKKIYQGLTTTLDESQHQYMVVVRAPYASRMTSLNALAQAKLNAIDARQASASQISPNLKSKDTREGSDQPTASVNSASAGASVADAVKSWATAWVNKDLTAYYASYVNNYRGDFPTPALWKQRRAINITQAKSIGLDFEHVEIKTLAVNVAQARFLQNYESNLIKEKVTKTLVFVKQEGRWLIQKESME